PPLLFLLPLAFLLFPASARSPGDRVSRWDWAWVVGSVLPCLYVLPNVHELTERWEGVHPVSHAQVLVGTVLVIAVLEAARRAVGFWFFVTTLAFMAFLVLAPWLPGFLRSPRAYSYPRLIEMFYLYADEGVLGTLTGISSNILMIFILFASVMLYSGVGQFFMDISVALAGRFRGGPAKVAVLSSALYSLGSAIVVSWFAGSQPMTPRRIFDTLGEAMRSGVIVATVLAASGLIVAAMSRTGVALAFSSAVINLSGGHLLVALFLIFL